MAKLPPIPVGIPPGHSYWNDWYEKLRNLINSSLLNHNDLLNIQGGNATERYHLTAAEHTALTTNNYQYVQVTSDFTTTATSPVDIPGLSFTPQANKEYAVDVFLYLTSSSTSSGPQPGLSFPTGLTNSAFKITATTSQTTEAILNSNANSTLDLTNTGFPDTVNSYPGIITCSFKTGASPSGDFKVRMSAS
jgi:hypothetical protein